MCKMQSRSFLVSADAAIWTGKLDGALRMRGLASGLADLLISATALEMSFGVVTLNWRHFHPVPGLHVMRAVEL